MATLGDDCYFFCTSTCSKGAACTFRHVEAAKMCPIICQHWQMGGCFRPLCKFRHSTFEIPLSTSERPCYWETQPSGCTKVNCSFKHSKPRPNAVAVVASTAELPSATAPPVDPVVAGSEASESSKTSFVSPVVKPVIIQASESEESNTSPVKRPHDDVLEKEQSPTKKAKGLETEKLENKENTKGKTHKSGLDSADAQISEPHTEASVKKTKIVKKTKKLIGKPVKGIKVSGKKVKKIPPKATASKPLPPVQKKLKKKEVVKAKNGSHVPKLKSVKDRLGSVPTQRPVVRRELVLPKQAESSGEESSDSLENVNVLSMEEIFRRKALESMLKKRAELGKELLVTEKSEPIKTVARTNSAAIAKVSPQDSSSSSEEEAEDIEAAASSTSTDSSDSSEDSDSSSSQSEEPDVRRVIVDTGEEKTSTDRAKARLVKKHKKVDSATTNVLKRAVIGGRVEKAVRKSQNKLLDKALKSSVKNTEIRKRRAIKVDSDFIDTVTRAQRPLRVQDRLGKPTMGSSKVRTSSTHSIRPIRLASPSDNRERPGRNENVTKALSSSDEESEGDRLAEIKVKTLEQIRQEKLLQAGVQDQRGDRRISPVKQRLELPASRRSEVEVDEKEERQVMLVTGQKSDSQSVAKPSVDSKKAKRRPWRSTKQELDELNKEEEDKRTAVITTNVVRSEADDSAESELGRKVEESLFEQLKRRALMRKMQEKSSGKLKVEPTSPDGTEDVEEKQETTAREVVTEEGRSAKSSRRKHKHKHHKKSKVEQQIYMPPARKKSVAMVRPTQTLAASPEKSPPSNREPEPSLSKTQVASVTSEAPRDVLPEVSRKRGPHPMSSVWAAGLSLNAKGVVPLRPEMRQQASVVNRLDSREATAVKKVDDLAVMKRLGTRGAATVKVSAQEPKSFSQSMSASASESTGVTIKSFSEIMAEKRARRLAMQAQKTGKAPLSPPSAQAASSSLSSAPAPAPAPAPLSNSCNSSPSRPEARTRVPITPIIFDKDSTASGAVKESFEISSTSVAREDKLPCTANSAPDKSQGDLTHTDISTVRLKSNEKTTKPSTTAPGKKTKGKKLFKKKKSADIFEGELDFLDAGHDNAFVFTLPSQSSAVSSSTSSITPVSANPAATAASSVHQSSSDSQSAIAGVGDFDSISETNLSSFSKMTASAPTTSGKKSPVLNTETQKTKSRDSLDSESIFDGIDMGADEDVITGDVESLDDLLQDIDDLLA